MRARGFPARGGGSVGDQGDLSCEAVETRDGSLELTGTGVGCSLDESIVEGDERVVVLNDELLLPLIHQVFQH